MDNYSFNEWDIQQQVLQCMIQNGIIPYDQNLQIITDGDIHRFRLQNERASQKGGAYCIFTDPWPAGFVQDWHNGGDKVIWSFPRDKLNEEGKSFFDDNRYKRAQAECKKRREQIILEREKKQTEASELARVHFSNARPAPEDHPYLKKKNVRVLGLRIINDDLIVPLCNADGRFMSFQRISPNGDKKFFYDAPKKGAFYSVALDCINNEQPILIAEGYATIATIYDITGLPCVAAMDCGNLLPVAEALKAKYPDNKIIFMADNDFRTKDNPGITKAQEACDKLHLHGVIAPEFNSDDNGSDWNDFFALHGEDTTKRILLEKIRYACLTPERKKLHERIEVINAEDLRNKHFDPVKWAVEGFLPSGCTILAGSPKVGKSILALHLAIGVAIGGIVLDKIKVQKGDVLYLALEDNQRRLKDRINGSDLLIDDDCDNEKSNDPTKKITLDCLTLATKVPRQHEGGIEFLDWWLDEHPNARLVIIDTLQKFRKLLSGKGSMYAEDYEVISQIKDVAEKFKVPVLIIHHLKKAREESDWLNEFSGSQGIAGSADTLFSLKRQRTDNHAILHRTGRDVEEKDFSMRIDRFGWMLEGEAELFTMPEWKRQIMDYLKEHETISPMDLAQAVNIPVTTARKNLSRLAKEGMINKIGHGTYALKK